MKAILVIDIPEDHILKTTNDLYDRLKGYKCELKPMPERVVENVWNKDWVAGWNAYYDTLTDFEDDPLKKELEK